MSKEDSGVYAIKNRITGEVYVGRSIELKRRFAHHRYLLDAGAHHNQRLQDSWSKWGEVSFDWILIHICDPECTYAFEWWALQLIPEKLRLNACPIRKHVAPTEDVQECRRRAFSDFVRKWKTTENHPVQIMTAESIAEKLASADMSDIARRSKTPKATLYRIREGRKPQYRTLVSLSEFFANEANNG